MPTYHNMPQRTDEWFEIKLGKIGGSEFSKLFMKPTTQGYKDLVLSKAIEIVTGVAVDDGFAGSYWTRRGTDLEPPAVKEYEKRTFNKVHAVGFVEMNEFVGCSPDGLIGENGGFEGKCLKYSNHVEMIKNPHIPKDYLWQCIGFLFVTKRAWIDFNCFHPGLKSVTIRLTKEECAADFAALQEALVKTIAAINNEVKFLRS